MLGWHETSRVDLGGNQSARFCAFQAKPFSKNRYASFHKGRLFCALEERKAVVKTFCASGRDETECLAELEKQRVSRDVINRFTEIARQVKLVPKFIANVEVVSFMQRYLSSQPRLKKNSMVVIQDRVVQANLRRFFPWEAYHPLQPSAPSCPRSVHRPPGPLLRLASASYAASGGQFVVIGTKGVIAEDSGVTTYQVTSLVVHSADGRFGASDNGREGMADFLKATGLSTTLLRSPLQEHVRWIKPASNDPEADLSSGTAFGVLAVSSILLDPDVIPVTSLKPVTVRSDLPLMPTAPQTLSDPMLETAECLLEGSFGTGLTVTPNKGTVETTKETYGLELHESCCSGYLPSAACCGSLPPTYESVVCWHSHSWERRAKCTEPPLYVSIFPL